MDDEMEDFIEGCFEEPLEIDEAYEFDASRFFDFTRPESSSDVEEAERWFEISGNYPPSPFIVKLNLGKAFSADIVQNSSIAKDSKQAKPVSNSSEVHGGRSVSSSKKNTKGACKYQDPTKTKSKAATKICEPKSSTLMRPTASHLAKQNKLQDTSSSCPSARFQKNGSKIEEKIMQSPPRFDNLGTKRQKLEIGYLRKVAHLKHQILLVHKLTKKVTVPKEPELETLLRAQRRGSKSSSQSSEHEKPKSSTLTEQPLSKKAPSVPRPKQKMQQSPEIQVPNSHKSASHLRSGGADSKRKNSRGTLKPDKHNASLNSKSQKVFPSIPDDDAVQDIKQDTMPLTESKISFDNSLLQEPPTELINKLSLQSDSDRNKVCQPKKHLSNKGVNENVPNSFQPEFWKCHANPSQCGGQIRAPESECWSNRCLGIS